MCRATWYTGMCTVHNYQWIVSCSGTSQSYAEPSDVWPVFLVAMLVLFYLLVLVQVDLASYRYIRYAFNAGHRKHTISFM